MIGAGMIFDETYRPAFERLRLRPIYRPDLGVVPVELVGLASRTGNRARKIQHETAGSLGEFPIVTEPDAVANLLALQPHAVCVATPDDRHFEACRKVLQAGRHLLVEKPSVLSVAELDELVTLAAERNVLAKVVYHKLFDPDHKKLRTLVADGVLQHCNGGYCSLLEPISIAKHQFAEWIAGRNPATYVAVHYIKLIDFTFGGRLVDVQVSGQRGILGPADGDTWDSVQVRLIYETPAGRSAAFDIHTSWVTPDNFPGYVEQEVQFRFDNGIWNGHSRKRGVELTVAGKTPTEIKSTLNNHYSASFLEPTGERSRRGYGLEPIERFFEEVAQVEFAGPANELPQRLQAMQVLTYNDLSADRQVVQAVEAIERQLQSMGKISLGLDNTHNATSRPKTTKIGG